MDAIDNITIGHTERLYKPVGYTMLTNLVNIVPFCLSIEAVRIIFGAFDGSGQPLDTTRLWYIFGIMAVYMLVMSWGVWHWRNTCGNFHWVFCPDVTPAICLPCSLRTSCWQKPEFRTTCLN